MPKRSIHDKIDRYARKIRRLQQKEDRRHHRIIDSSDSEENSDNESPCIDEPEVSTENLENTYQVENQNETPEAGPEAGPEPVNTPALNPDVLTALGEATEETPKFGEPIHENLASLWLPILRKGLKKDNKEATMKKFPIPENCSLLQAPKLNPEISAAASDSTRLRDKRVEAVQQQLGRGITALNRGLSLLLENDTDRVQAIKFLSDSCRLLCDLHFVETEARKKFVTPGLDKSFLNIIQEVDRDEMLFGNKLSEKIKASKAIEKQGLQIKKLVPPPKPAFTSSNQSTASRPRSQVNWSGPPRYPSNRGGRGGQKRTTPAGRRAPPAAHQSKSSNQSKQRAPIPHQ